jgi:hypothetical protein
MNFDSSPPPPFFSDLILFPISLLDQPQRPVPNSNTVTWYIWSAMAYGGIDKHGQNEILKEISML